MKVYVLIIVILYMFQQIWIFSKDLIESKLNKDIPNARIVCDIFLLISAFVGFVFQIILTLK